MSLLRPEFQNPAWQYVKWKLALQFHAAEVSDMVDRGMQAVHDAMAQRVGD